MNLVYHPNTDKYHTPEDYFAIEEDDPPRMIAEKRLMIAFLHHLRQHVSDSHLEVRNQMFGLWFFHSDYHGTTRVEPRNEQLLFSYYIPDAWTGWDDARVEGSTNDVVTATEMLLASFMYRPLPIEWRNHIKYPHHSPKTHPEEYRRLSIQLHPLHDEAPGNILEHYTLLQENHSVRKRYEAEIMLKFVNRIHNENSHQAYWFYVDGTDLVFVDRNTPQQTVTIRPVSKIGYSIQYKLPTHRAPWPNALVVGRTNSLDEADHMTAIALERVIGTR